MFIDKHTEERPKAKVNHSVKFILHDQHNRQVRTKRTLIVHEPPPEFRMDASEQKEVDLQNYCSPAGKGIIRARFNKNVFYANEVAQALVQSDNSQSDLTVAAIHFSVLHKLTIRSGDHVHVREREMIRQTIDCKEEPRKAPYEEYKCMDLPLGNMVVPEVAENKIK